MIHIKKSSPPNKFQEFKQQNPQAHFDDMPLDIKVALRKSLLEEQGYLCSYCMSKIRDKVKIEHYEPRNLQNELDYSNLLAVCTGNSAGNQREYQHCDTKKGNKHLHINPQNVDHIKQISYRSDGTIYAKDNDDFNADLNFTLNLNDEHGYLKANRKKALDVLKRKILSNFGDKVVGCAFAEKLLKTYLSKNRSGELTPYCGILIDYLTRHLKKWSQSKS